jgi:hypothetical protein
MRAVVRLRSVNKEREARFFGRAARDLQTHVFKKNLSGPLLHTIKSLQRWQMQITNIFLKGTVEQDFGLGIFHRSMYCIMGPDFKTKSISIFSLFAKLFVFFDNSSKEKKIR